MQRPSWVWAALPPDTQKILCLAGSGLADALREVGLEVIPGEAVDDDDVHAFLGEEGRPGAAQAAVNAAQNTTSRVVAIAVGPSASPSLRPVSRAARVMHLLGSPMTAVRAEATAKRLAQTMAREGLGVSRIRTGDRSLPRYGIGPGGWTRRRRVPGGAIVIGSASQRPPSVIEEVIARAAGDLRRPLNRLSSDVFPSGKIAIELADPENERYFLSIAAGETGGLDRSRTAIDAILAADPPPSLRERIVQPLAVGTVGPVRYVLEPKATGHHPVWISPRLWRQCVEFLVDLYQLSQHEPEASLVPAWPDLPAATDLLGRRANRDERILLGRITREIEERTAGLECGVGHGDFFTKNVLVWRGRLGTVLDWEWAASGSLPLLDLLDLRAQLGWRRRRGLRVGQNFTEILWPLARQGGDAPVRHYCQAVGVPNDPHLLEGLAMAHWLLRTARLGSLNPRRLEDTGWWRANVAAPMATIRDECRGLPR